MRPYVIYTFPYMLYSAGIRTLYKLCDALRSKGQEAYVTEPCPHPLWNAPRIPNGNIPQNGIAVYPEIIHGNPLQLSRRVRWALNYPGLLGGPTEYEPDELVFTFLDSFIPKEKKLGNLFICTYEPEYFNLEGIANPRRGACFWVGKGGRTQRQLITEGIAEITGSWPGPREAVAKLLKEVEYFITYDNQTALIDEARLCGCPVVIIKDPHFNWNIEHMGLINKVGITYDILTLDAAKETVDQFPALHQKRLEEADKQLDKFIELTQYA